MPHVSIDSGRTEWISDGKCLVPHRGTHTQLSERPGAAGTQDHKLGTLKQQKLTVSQKI